MQWNTTQIIGVVVAAIIVVGGGYYLSTGPTSGGAMEDNSRMMGGAFSGSITDLMARGGSYQCTVDSTTNGVHTTGKVYVAGTDMRGDFTLVTGAKTDESHMIRAGADMYVWSSAMPGGIKMATPDAATAGTANTSGQGFDQATAYSWDCDSWSRDESLLTPPSNIEFMDMNAMMQGSMPSY